MTLELPVDDVYLEMLEQIEGERGTAEEDLARVIEGVIHENYQQLEREE